VVKNGLPSERGFSVYYWTLEIPKPPDKPSSDKPDSRSPDALKQELNERLDEFHRNRRGPSPMKWVIVGVVTVPLAFATPLVLLLWRKKRQLDAAQDQMKEKIGELSREYPQAVREWGGPRVLDNASTVQELINGLEHPSLSPATQG